ncbi:PTS sugar transporter subunit IIA [Thermaerobacter litoralis]
MKRWIAEEGIALDVQARDWETAVEEAGRLLVAIGAAQPSYVQAMVATVRELGPYIVIAPGIALPHARPDAGALRSAVSFVRLRPAVPFGNQDLDPVDLVFGLAAVDGEAHLEMMADLATVLGDDTIVQALRAARSAGDVLRILSGDAEASWGHPGT